MEVKGLGSHTNDADWSRSPGGAVVAQYKYGNFGKFEESQIE